MKHMEPMLVERVECLAMRKAVRVSEEHVRHGLIIFNHLLVVYVAVVSWLAV